MKKSLLIVSALVLVQVAIAQPSLTNANTSPAVGESYTITNTQYVSPGTAGAGQTWNLSSMTSAGPTTYNMVTVASTPHSATFGATSTVAAAAPNNNYLYFNNSASAMQNTGIGSPAGTIPYQNPEDLLRYPFDYLDTYVDNFSSSYNLGVASTRIGTTTVTYDGHGTLILPSGTYANVARVHLQQNYDDSSQVIQYNTTNDQYYWYLPGNHYPIATVYTLVNSFSGTTSAGFYLNSIVGVPENQMITKLDLYPNPAAEKFTVGVTPGEVDEIQISGIQGNVVMTMPTSTASSEITVITSSLEAGTYFVAVLKQGAVLTTRKMIICR